MVVDGGTAEDKDYLIEYIQEKDDNDTVNAWLITHYHGDHSGALTSFLLENEGEITINKIYLCLPGESDVSAYDSSRLEDYNALVEALSSYENVEIVSAGDIISLKEFKIEVINDMQVFENNFGNNTSIVYQVQVNNSTFLILGDCGEELSEYLLTNYADKIKDNTIVQMAHHGQRGGTQELYEWINPKICLWPLTDWIYTNNNGTTDLKYEETQEWIDAIGSTNYYAKDGTQIIELK